MPFRRSLILAFALILALGGLAAHAANLAWSEASLSGLNKYPDVNAGAGVLVVTGNTEVWRIDPVTGAYTTYTGLGGAIDARPDAAGNIWFSNWSDELLVRINQAGVATSWPMPAGSWGLWGVAFDNAGRVWTADSYTSNIFRLDPAANQRCSYVLPGDGRAEYISYHNGMLWLGDFWKGRVMRLNPNSGALAWWEVDIAAWPEGLVIDAAGDVWFTDYNLGVLGRLNPDTNQLTRYTPPAGRASGMVTLVADRIWYTDSDTGTVGVLDPATAVGATVPASTGSDTLTPQCEPISPSQTTPTTRQGTLAFTDLTPTVLADANGWTVFGLPSGSITWGIAQSANALWIADGGRKKLLRAAEATPVTPTPTATVTLTPTITTTPTPSPTATATKQPTDWVYLPLITR